MGVTEKLAGFMVNTHYSDFDSKTVTRAKELILNGLGAMMAANRERVVAIAVKLTNDSGGNPEVGVIGQGFKTSLSNAAFIGGISVHAIEQEACGTLPGGPPFCIIPAALGVAEKYKLSGKTIIEGFVMGHELQGRLGIGCPGGANRGWSGVYFPMGVAAAVAKMLGLDSMQTRMALAIVTDAMGGTWRECGYMDHFGQGGNWCRNGLTAALLAKEGMTADPDIIDGEGGYGEFVGEFDPEKILKDLGKPFYTLSPGVAIKKYNCCFGSHRAIEALWQILFENDIRYEQIEDVEVKVPKFVTRLIHYNEPENGDQAKFSLEHSFAVLLVDRPANQMTRSWSFTNEGVADPKYKEARKKVKVIVIEQGGGRHLVGKEMPVTVRLKDGRSFTKVSTVLKGSSEFPLSQDEIVARYEEHASEFLSDEQVERTVDMIMNLEKTENANELINIMTYGNIRN